ncbi:hypothetical protein ACH5RR_038126 [Cinchona calisaya]|uniref:Oleosin n=1 Tax=Cinchona calisaya TaxID=153742 RepID=A0ABD2YB71_9GENT
MGGPLFGLMGFIFLANSIFLLPTSPLLITFSPVLFGVASVLGFELAGFGAAAASAFVRMDNFTWAFKSFNEILGLVYDVGRGPSSLMDSCEAVKERGKDWAGYLQMNPQENLHNRG